MSWSFCNTADEQSSFMVGHTQVSTKPKGPYALAYKMRLAGCIGAMQPIHISHKWPSKASDANTLH